MPETAIVLVDDERAILDCLREQLERELGARYVYEAAESVDEAWEVLGDLESEGIAVAAVISDWLMPGVRGDEFFVQLRSRLPSARRVLLTGQADAAAIARARGEGGAHGVLSKPWSAVELRQVLEPGAAP